MKHIVILIILTTASLMTAQVNQSLLADSRDFFKTYSSDNLIDYGRLVRESSDFKRLIKRFKESPLPTDEQHLEFYTHAYNLMVINKIIDNYPINSVKQIPQFFDSDITVAGQSLTLNSLEKMLLDHHESAGIHLLLVCGALDCPAYPVFEDDLDLMNNRLDSMYFNADIILVDDIRKEIYLSSILKWYSDDFGAKDDIIAELSLAHQKDYSNYDVVFNIYDWGLNDIFNDQQDRYIPTRLLIKGESEIKLFNNYYTHSEPMGNAKDRTSFMSYIFNWTFGSNKNFNWGLYARARSVRVHPVGGNFGYFDGINLRTNTPYNGGKYYSRFGLTAVGLQARYRTKWNTNGNNVILHTITFPTSNDLEGNSGKGYIDWNGISVFNQWYYDRDLTGQTNIFFDTGFNFENVDSRVFQKEGGYMLVSTPFTAIYSYYPKSGTTFYGLGTVAPRIALQNYGSISTEFSPFGQIGAGIKQFISDNLELEILITQFFGGPLNRNAQTLNFGIRYTN